MNGTIRYTVRPYDTFWMLAQVFNTTADSIMELNPGVDPRNLQVGHVITIRPGFQYYFPYPTDNNTMGNNMPGIPNNGGMMNGGMMNDGMMNRGMMDGGMMNGGMVDGGMMNRGMVDGGMMNRGMMNDGMMNDGMMNDGGMMDGGMMNRGMVDGGMLNRGMMNDGMMNDYMLDDDCEVLADLTYYFRMLWGQHVMWTRMVMLGMLFDLPELEFSTQRLLRNATDFANALRPFYGDEAAQTFENLLSGHITIFGELINAAEAADTNQVDAIWQRWLNNANEIAEFLANSNPNWSIEDWSAMMMEHLEMLRNNLSYMLEQNYSAAVDSFDDIDMQAMEMADMMAEGIAMQFSD